MVRKFINNAITKQYSLVTNTAILKNKNKKYPPLDKENPKKKKSEKNAKQGAKSNEKETKITIVAKSHKDEKAPLIHKDDKSTSSCFGCC